MKLSRFEAPGRGEGRGASGGQRGGGGEHVLNRAAPDGGSRHSLEPLPEPTTSEPAPTAGLKTVLYGEDNLANLDLVQSILRSRTDIVLLPALQGQVGLELAREHNPDLILLDLHLPDPPR